MSGEGSALEHLELMQPKSFMGEQVSGFLCADPLHPLKHTFAQQMVAKISAIRDTAGVSIYKGNIQLVQLKASDWAQEVERNRLGEQYCSTFVSL